LRFFQALPWTKKAGRSSSICCPPEAFNNILSQIQVEMTTPAHPGFPPSRCYWFLRPVSRGDGISAPQPTSAKISCVCKDLFFFKNLRSYTSGHGKKLRGTATVVKP